MGRNVVVALVAVCEVSRIEWSNTNGNVPIRAVGRPDLPKSAKIDRVDCCRMSSFFEMVDSVAFLIPEKINVNHFCPLGP